MDNVKTVYPLQTKLAGGIIKFSLEKYVHYGHLLSLGKYYTTIRSLSPTWYAMSHLLVKLTEIGWLDSDSKVERYMYKILLFPHPHWVKTNKTTSFLKQEELTGLARVINLFMSTFFLIGFPSLSTSCPSSLYKCRTRITFNCLIAR